MSNKLNFSELTLVARNIAIIAGHEIMKFYSPNISYRNKNDQSPVTEADEASDKIITSELKSTFPEIKVISEESFDENNIDQTHLSDELFWLVDPLDGTKEFISGNGEFTVNIALIKQGKPLLGVIYIPYQKYCYVGEIGSGAVIWNEEEDPKIISARTPPFKGPVVLASRSHLNSRTEEWIRLSKPSAIINAGSALKFALLAKGEADLYPRFSPTMEWDTAAGHAILLAAGGSISLLDGQELAYGKKSFLNPEFIGRGKPTE